MTRRASALAPVLRSETQARLLAATLLQPEREASIAELARETGSDPGNLHAEVERLVQAGTSLTAGSGERDCSVPATVR